MTYIITEPCIDVLDKGCIDVCPMDCIHGTDNDKMLYIDPEECIDCGGCVPACPANAIFLDAEVPEQWKHYTQINANYFNGKTNPGKVKHTASD
jgi:ferredoxin